MNIIIVGLGVIGGSYALCLKEAGYKDVYGIDIDKETLKKAEKMGIIKKGFMEEHEIIKEADLIILSVYPELIKEFINKNKHNFKNGVIITDTAGVKGLFIDEVIDMLPRGVDFVFGHPMAGRENRGIDFASKDVFKGANYLIIKNNSNKPESISLIKDLAYSIGFKNIKEISHSYHDEIIAFTSQLPHVLAVSLINSDEENRDTGKFIGDSYRDFTRIANINEKLWSELFIGNKDNLLKSINNFERELNKLKNCIEVGDSKGLKEEFKKSTMRRERL